MNPRTPLWLVGVVVGAVAFSQSAALCAALAYSEPWMPFVSTAAFGLGVSALLILPFRGQPHSLDHRSAFLAVTGSWIAACLVGAGPLLQHPDLSLSPVDALFESTSGFTTTGATVLSGLDNLPRSLLLWRSLMQWLGGMGIVLLGVAVLPVLGLGGMQLYRAEAPGPSKDKLTPRIAETAKLFWLLYVSLTAVCGALLWLGGMTPFDALCHGMTTIATGGFSTHDASLGFYDSGFIHLVTAGFMLVGGTSFVLLHRALTRGITWSESPELRAYLGIFAAVAALIALELRLGDPASYATVGVALEHAIFQSASILSTSGFVTRDYDLWPPMSHALLFSLYFVGGMAGSTSGGIKVIRVLIAVKLAFSQFFRLVHPHGFGSVKLKGETVDATVILGVLGFIGIYLVLLLAGTVLIAGFGSDLLTSFVTAVSTLGNVGPAFAETGPSRTFAGFEPGAKLVMIALMLLGRLEIYTALVILAPSFWRD